MIHYILNSDIDKESWDATVSEATNGTVCAFSWFLDIVSPGWGCLIKNDYSELFPLTRSRKYGINYLRQPFYTQQLGLISKERHGNIDCEEYLEEACKRFKFIEINLRFNNFMNLNMVTSTSKLNLVLDINRNYKDIYKDYSVNHKRNIKKTQNGKLVVNRNGNLDDVIKLFKENRGKYLYHYSETEYNILSNLIREADKRSMSSTYIISGSNGLPCAGAVFIIKNKTALFLFSGVNNSGRQSGAMNFLIDEFIKSNAQKLHNLDFEGSNDENLARFYRGFGSIESVYLHIKYNNLPIPIRWFK